MNASVSRPTVTKLLIGATSASASILAPEQFIIQENIKLATPYGNFPTYYVAESGYGNQSIPGNFFIADNVHRDGYMSLERELYGYLQLEPDWDYNGGIVPQRDCIEAGCDILKKLKEFELPAPKSMLASDGEVCFYWKKDGRYIEIGIEDRSHFSYLIDNRQEPFGEDGCRIDNFYNTRLFTSLNNI